MLSYTCTHLLVFSNFAAHSKQLFTQRRNPHRAGSGPSCSEPQYKLLIVSLEVLLVQKYYQNQSATWLKLIGKKHRPIDTVLRVKLIIPILKQIELSANESSRIQWSSKLRRFVTLTHFNVILVKEMQRHFHTFICMYMVSTGHKEMRPGLMPLTCAPYVTCYGLAPAYSSHQKMCCLEWFARVQ